MADKIDVEIRTPSLSANMGQKSPIIYRTGATDYEELDNKPQINDITLIGNKTFDDLGLSRISADELLTMLRGIFN